MKSCPQFFNRFRMKTDDIGYSGDMPDKTSIIVAVFNAGCVSLVSHRVHMLSSCEMPSMTR